MVFGAIAGIAGAAASIGGGILGSKDARDAQRLQEEYLNAARNNQYWRYGEIRRGFNQAEPFMDEMLGVAQGLRDDLLGQTDPLMAAQVRRIRQEREMQSSLANQAMVQRGLDSFTTRQSAQSQASGQAMNAYNDLMARMSALRQSAIGAGTQAEMSALGQRGNFEVQRGQALGDVWNSVSQINAGVQIAPANTGAAIGQLGALGINAWQTSVLNDALAGI